MTQNVRTVLQDRAGRTYVAN